MNANELADELFKEKNGICHVAATMLRQQQAEIEALKKEIQNQSLDNLMDWQQELDTAKTLTDEEIDLIAGMVPTIPTGWDLIEFARAILRKANEK